MEVEFGGFPATMAFEQDPRWMDGPTYVFVMDTMGNQLITGSRLALNGTRVHEWGRRGHPGDQFGDRDIPRLVDTFGEAYIYYRSINPSTGAFQKKGWLI